MALTSLDKVKEWLKLQTTAADDELIQRLIDSASAFIERWLGYNILRHEVIDWFDGKGKNEIVLTNPHILSINSIFIDDRIIAPDQYRQADWWIILKNECFPRGRRNVCIAYDVGFDTVPADIENVVIDLVGLAYSEQDRIGFQSKSLAGETVSFFTGALSDRSKIALEHYKRVIPG